MTLQNFLSNLLDKTNDAIIVGSLGNISKTLQELDNKKNRLVLIKGAMGCVTGVGLGIALNTSKKVIVLIGDGAFLMKQGSMATILKYKPKNLEIIILNNNRHESCGGQPTNFQFIRDYLPSSFFKIKDIE